MYVLLHHKTTHEVNTLLHKQRWSSTRQNIPFETFEVKIYATLDARRKNGLQFSSGSNAWHGVMLNKEILLQWKLKQTRRFCYSES